MLSFKLLGVVRVNFPVIYSDKAKRRPRFSYHITRIKRGIDTNPLKFNRMRTNETMMTKEVLMLNKYSIIGVEPRVKSIPICFKKIIRSQTRNTSLLLPPGESRDNYKQPSVTVTCSPLLYSFFNIPMMHGWLPRVYIA